MDAPIFDFFAYLSARYAVKRDRVERRRHRGLLPPRPPLQRRPDDRRGEEVARLLHHELRPVPAPPGAHPRVPALRHASPQSFPNTIPFSESIGFIARLDDKPDAHRLRLLRHRARGGAPVVGAPGDGRQRAGRRPCCPRRMSQYSALMVMEKEYGRDKMRRFLQLRARPLPAGPRRRADRGAAARTWSRTSPTSTTAREPGDVRPAATTSARSRSTRRSAPTSTAVTFQEPPYTYTPGVPRLHQAGGARAIARRSSTTSSATSRSTTTRRESATWTKRDGRQVRRAASRSQPPSSAPTARARRRPRRSTTGSISASSATGPKGLRPQGKLLSLESTTSTEADRDASGRRSTPSRRRPASIRSTS